MIPVPAPDIDLVSAVPDGAIACERILRSLPQWFGIEAALLAYAQAVAQWPTFLARTGNDVRGFVTLKRHFKESAEVHCIAVHATSRGQGLGGRLLAHAENWAAEQGVRFLSVKTLAATHPSPAYAQTRAFYEHMGYARIEVISEIWTPENPCLLMVKELGNAC
jgi:GNAT superfamily N-acetyltransferase